MSQLERRVILSWPTICVLAPEADIVTNGLPFSLERHVRSTRSRHRQAAPACPLLPTRPIQRV